MRAERCKIGIIGFGNFSQFAVPYLSSEFDVMVYDRIRRLRSKVPEGVSWGTLQEVASRDVVIPSIPQYPGANFISLLKQIRSLIRPATTVLNVCSNMMTPIELMNEFLPDCRRENVHWLFGPKGGAKGIEGLKAVICQTEKSHSQTYEKMIRFLEDDLELRTIVTTPETHDRAMATVQGRTHFLGRLLQKLEIKKSPKATLPYRQLYAVMDAVCSDSRDLFLTTQLGNPFASLERQLFLNKAKEVREKIRIAIQTLDVAVRKVDVLKGFSYFVGWTLSECGIAPSEYSTKTFDRQVELAKLATSGGWKHFIRFQQDSDVSELVDRLIREGDKMHESLVRLGVKENEDTIAA